METRLGEQQDGEDIRLTEDETREVIALWSERNSPGGAAVTDPRPRFEDLAAGLGIGADEARRLVLEVRRRKAEQAEQAEQERLAGLARQREEVEQRIRDTEAERLRIEEETRLAEARRRLAEEEGLRLEAERRLARQTIAPDLPHSNEPLHQSSQTSTTSEVTDAAKEFGNLAGFAFLVLFVVVFLFILSQFFANPMSPFASPPSPPPGMRPLEGAPGAFVPQNQDRAMDRSLAEHLNRR